MTDRPYFHYGVDDLEKVFEAAPNDAVLLSALRRELEHRTVPKARDLRTQVDQALLRVGRRRPPPETTKQIHQQVSVGCSHCGRTNLVSVGGAALHLSCSGCFKPFVIEFENGIMKVSFPIIPAAPAPASRLWIGVVLAAVLLAGLFFLFSART
jgi:hypothetical protein